MKHTFLVTLLSLSLLIAHAHETVSAQSTNAPRAQNNSSANPQADKIKLQVQKLGVGKNVTATLLNSKEYHGAISDIAADDFTITEVDLKQQITVRYDEAKKVTKGYGGKGVGGRRVNPRTNLIVGVAVVAAILIAIPLIVAVGTR